MKISRNWLSDFIDLDGVSDDELSAKLTDIGHAVDSVEPHHGDSVLEIEFTTNRIDAMSHRGLARDLSAAFARPLRDRSPGAEFGGSERVPIRIDSPELCDRYTGLVIRGVRVGESPDEVKQRLEAIGLRPINNIVDATNYVMMALGHPLHAFDLDLLEGPEIIVRAASDGEVLRTLDDVERKLDGKMVVIADGKRGVALGGVMGGGDTEIHDGTKNVLLECAHFNPSTVRRMSKALALFTDAAYRYERYADPNDTIETISECARMIVELAGGEASAPIDVVATKIEPKVILLRLITLKTASAGLIDLDEAATLLRPLGMGIETTSEALEVTVPTWRGDIGEEIDLIEEILRLYGYNRIPSELPRVTTGDVRPSTWVDLEDRFREIISGCGLSEIVTYSFIHPDHNRVFSDEKALEVTNALTENLSSMRLTLYPGLVQTLAHNWSYGVRDGAIYEIGRSYHRDGDSVKERHIAGFLCFGNASDHWSGGARRVDYFDAKGLVERALGAFHLEASFESSDSPFFAKGSAAIAKLDEHQVASFGVLSRAALDRFEVGGNVNVIAGSIDLGVISASTTDWEMEPASKYPGVPMVVAMFHSPELEYGKIVDTIRSLEIPFLREVGVWDRFVPESEGGEVKTALGLWYQSNEKSLTQEEVAEVHGGLVKQVVERLPVRLVD